MKSLFTILCVIVLSGLSSGQYVQQQLIGWQYAVPITATSTFSSVATDEIIRVIVDTETPILAGKMNSSGNDIRFTDSCGVVVFPHWVRSGINTSTTEIWVMIDEIAPLSDRVIYMVYGNDTAANTSDFNQVFTNSYVSSGNDTISGMYGYQWFEVAAGDTIFLEDETGFLSMGVYAEIGGVINGIGKGELGGAVTAAGSGTGGGGGSSNSGAGGGSYGGVGGTGGYDAGDTPGTGGPVYDDASSTSISMGSGGGGGVSSGGNGGGGVYLVYTYLTLNGTIVMDGAPGIGGSRGSGGGSGGGILLAGNDIDINGTLSAAGGNGGVGTSTANDDGGGGGGGRIKIFYENTFSISGPQIVTGGLGGPYGSAAPATNGGDGSTHTGYMMIDKVSVTSVDTEVGFNAGTPIEVYADSIVCEGYGTTIAIENSFLNYEFFLNGSSEYSGTDSSYSYPLLIQDDEISLEATNTCGTYYYVYTIDAVPNPVPVITEGFNELHAGTQYVSYQWYYNGSIIGGATNESLIVTASGFYRVEVTDSNGCTGISDQINVILGLLDEQVTEIQVYPNPAEDVLHLSFYSSDYNNINVAITDLTGRQIWVANYACVMGNNQIVLPVDFLEPGAYYVRFADKAEYSKAFLKQ